MDPSSTAGLKVTVAVNSSGFKADTPTSEISCVFIAFVSNSEALALILNPPPTIVVAKAAAANF